MPNADGLDGPVSYQVFAPSGATSGPTGLGSYRSFRALCDARCGEPSNDVMLFQRPDGATSFTTLGQSSAATASLGSAPSLPAARVASDGRVLVAEDNALNTVSSSGSSARLASVPMPKPGQLYVDGKMTKFNADDGSGSVAVVLQSRDGTVFAFSNNAVNSLVSDVSHGRQLELLKYGYINDAVLAADGKMYAIARDTSRSSAQVALLVLDPTGLTVLKVADSPITASGGRLDSVQLVALTDGRVYFYASQATATGGHASRLFQYDAGSFITVKLADNMGTRVAVGPDDALYLYGGIGKNVIHRVDPTTGTAETVQAVSLPDSVHIVGLFVH